MNQQFAIGEIAILFWPEHECHGEEVIVMSLLMPPYSLIANRKKNMLPAYSIENGLFSGFVPPEMLRKKKPPKEDASWDRIEELTHWNPNRIEVPA